MKRLYPTALALVSAIITAWMPVAAQSSEPEPDRFGVDLMYELAIPSGSHGVWSTGSGATVTGSYDWHFAPRWTFSPAVGGYYNTMGINQMITDHTLYDSTVKNYGLRLPLMVGFDIVSNENFNFRVSTGPWVNVNLYARQSAMAIADARVPVPRSINMFHYGFRRVEGLWGISLSMTFNQHYRVGVTSSVAFTPLASYGNQDNKIKVFRNTVAISLGYRF